VKVNIELRAGPDYPYNVTKKDIQKNIDALQRAVDGKPFCSDFVPLIDTKYILEGIKNKLEE